MNYARSPSVDINFINNANASIIVVFFEDCSELAVELFNLLVYVLDVLPVALILSLLVLLLVGLLIF